MHTYAPRVIADQATGRPLAGVRVTVEDAETGAPVQPYRDGAPVQLVTGSHGLITEWQTDETTRRVALTAGPVRLTQWCEELVGASGEAITELERLTLSHLERSTSGRLVFAQGTGTVPVTRTSTGRLAVRA
ncbi:hypothetical protein [Micrococcus luteus]|uniref:hypothetical protein n=1 Tax=Micrococcus luteus TaxID=1270 RepID=UPI003EB7A95F